MSRRPEVPDEDGIGPIRWDRLTLSLILGAMVAGGIGSVLLGWTAIAWTLGVGGLAALALLLWGE